MISRQNRRIHPFAPSPPTSLPWSLCSQCTLAKSCCCLCTTQRPELRVPPHVHRGIEKTKRVSLDWAALIARIYEVNPLICPSCGGKIKIIGFVVHAAEIHRIPRGLGWPIKTHEFDPPYDLLSDNLSQLVPVSDDGFPVEIQVHHAVAPDPPFQKSSSDPPHWDDHADPPHDSD